MGTEEMAVVGQAHWDFDKLMADDIDECDVDPKLMMAERVVRPSVRHDGGGFVTESGSLYGEHVPSAKQLRREIKAFDEYLGLAYKHTKRRSKKRSVSSDCASDPFDCVSTLDGIIAFCHVLLEYTQGISSTKSSEAQVTRCLLLAMAGLAYDWNMYGSAGHHTLGDFIQAAEDVQTGAFDRTMRRLVSGFEQRMSLDGRRVDCCIPSHDVNCRTRLQPGDERLLPLRLDYARGVRAGEDFTVDHYLMFLGLAGDDKGYFYDDVCTRLEPLKKLAAAAPTWSAEPFPAASRCI